MSGLELQSLVVSSQSFILCGGIFLESNSAREPNGCTVLARSCFFLRNRRGGDHVFASRKIHQKLSRNRLQQSPLMPKSYAMLCRGRCARLEQRISHPEACFRIASSDSRITA